jgi:hypothetical protein
MKSEEWVMFIEYEFKKKFGKKNGEIHVYKNMNKYDLNNRKNFIRRNTRRFKKYL